MQFCSVERNILGLLVTLLFVGLGWVEVMFNIENNVYRIGCLYIYQAV